MSLTIYYQSARPMTTQQAETIEGAAQKACKGRAWLGCEPLNFFPHVPDGVLTGGSKPNFKPHPKDKEAAQKSGLPNGTPKDLLDILASLSREHGIDWELLHDYGPIGSIRAGVVDPKAQAQVEALADIRF